jgi:hypothetical protein
LPTGLRSRLKLLCALGMAILLATAGSASAAGTWSSPQQVDTAQQHSVNSYLLDCTSNALCVGVDGCSPVVTCSGNVGDDGGPVVYTSSATGADTAFSSEFDSPFGSGYAAPYLTSLQCPSASLCLASAYSPGDPNTGDDSGDDVVVSADPGAGIDAWSFQGVSEAPAQLSCPSTGFCAGAAEDGKIAFSSDLTGGAKAWKATSLGVQIIEVECASAGFCIAFDDTGAIWTSTDPTGGATAWVKSAAPPPLASVGAGFDNDSFDDSGPLAEYVSCTGPSLCVAADPDHAGNVLVSTNPTGSSAWTSVNVGASAISAVYCLAGSTQCLAGDAKGDIASSSDGAGATWTAVSTPDVNGIADLTCTGQTCSATSYGGADPPLLAAVPAPSGSWGWGAFYVDGYDAMVSIACPAAGECIGTDGTRYYTSAHALAGSWRAKVPFAGQESLDIACYSASGCLAAGIDADNGFTDVGGGDLYSFSPVGGAHHFRDIDPGGGSNVDFVTCAQGACVAGYPGDWFASSHPATRQGWKAVRNPRFDVTCLRGNSDCVALADAPFPEAAGHDLLVAPRRGGPWKSENIDPTGYITGLACTSARACVVVDEGGNLIVSTRPTSGPASWRVSDTDPNGFNGVTCQNARRCVAVDADGGVVVGRP